MLPLLLLAAAQIAFDVASVKPAAPDAQGQLRGPKAANGRLDLPNVTLRFVIAFAYGVKEYQISGPSWLTQSRYDILAKAPDGTAHDQLPAMTQALLAERFQFQAHRETRDFSVYVLEIARNGPKLQESPADPDAPPGASFGISMSSARIGRLEGKRATMTSLANTLTRIVGSPVLDRTGLSGSYDLVLEFSPDDAAGMSREVIGSSTTPSSEPGASIFTSLQQAGLRLDARKVPLDAIVVDRAEKVPTGN